MGRPQNCITVQEAKDLQNNWNTTRAVVIKQSRNNQEDTCEFVFSLENLQEFLDYVKEESGNQGIDNPGVRIYFAAYDKKDNKNATVFLSATDGTSATADNNYNIDPLNDTVGGIPPKIY